MEFYQIIRVSDGYYLEDYLAGDKPVFSKKDKYAGVYKDRADAEWDANYLMKNGYGELEIIIC